ncbi:WD repeat domain phosphoinositide-interacting protein [Pimephales promelas]|nr:WD repeat domain phosphoinositide-interacting protein [Pimephales promelas]
METEEGADGPGGPGPGPCCVSFNQDSTSLAVGTKTGYKLFSVTSVDKLDCIHESTETPEVYIVERLFSSSLVVVVSQSMPRRMNVYHFKKGTEICNYSYSNNILAVRLNRQRLVVCLEESIYIHNIKDMKLLKTLLNTPSNPSGLCALSINHSNSFLAYPGSDTIGEIIVYDANNLSTVTMIPAHDSPLAAITFSASGTKLASASERGTVIRVFSVPEGLRLFEFRRGMKRYVNISSLSFSPDAQFLCASSNTETVHIFKLEQHSPSGEEEAPSWSTYVGKMFTAASSYLPAQVSGMMSQDRAFATSVSRWPVRRMSCTLAIRSPLWHYLSKRSNRSQASDPGRREGRRSLGIGIGMETEEGADGPGGPGPGPGPCCVSFNQDSTSLAVGTKTGYKLFSVTSVDKLDCIHESTETPEVYIVERLFSSSLVVVVSQSMPRRMNVYHFKKGTEICNYSYSNNILAVRLNRQRLVVCLEESIYIHNIKDMKLLKTLLNTPSNPSGLCALSINHSNSFLAYPGSDTIGEIIVYDANNLSTVTMIPAHDSPLAAITFSASGTKLASASERGTVIRVFSVPEGLRLFEFRRGMKRYVNISSLSFSPDAQFLCASSNTETVHIFKLEQHSPSGEEEAPSWSTYVGKMFTAASSYLPAQVSGMMSQDRAFATVRLQMAGQKNVCTLAIIQKLPRLLVASSDGQLFIYNIDPQDGGECTLVQKHRLFGSDKEWEETEKSELTEPPQACQSYAATVAIPTSGPVTATLTGYSEDGGAKKGEVIPEHEFAAGPVCLDDETEFPPINWCRDGSGRGKGRRP